MENLIKGLFCYALLTYGLMLSGASIDTKAKAARAYEGSVHVIKCGPETAGDVLMPIQALSVLKNGSTLQLMSGNYEGDIVITANKVLIIGDGSGKKCDVDLKISGKGCTIKNIWLDDILANNNLIVVDSIFSTLRSGYDNQGRSKLDIAVFNTCLTSIQSSWDNSKITLKNCTLVSEWGGSMCPIECNSTMRLTIINSILYAPSILFRFSDYSGRARSRGKLILDGCVVFGKSGLGRVGYSSSSGKKKLALNLKELKRIGNVAFKRGTKMQMPKFINQAKFSNSGSSRMGRITPKYFILTKDSPGKGKGVNVEENLILSKWAKDKTPDAE